jgi:predicted acylesterase/phospholipase RssA
MIWRRRRIGLALGAGGARGLAHIGVFRAFEDESIPVDLIVGSSIGALVGAAFASGITAREMDEMVSDFLESPTFQNSALKSIRGSGEQELYPHAENSGLFQEQVHPGPGHVPTRSASHR